MNRGDVCWYTFGTAENRRPVVILTRDSAGAVLHSLTVAPITFTIRNIPTEVVLTQADGLPTRCVANFDNIQTVPKGHIGDRIAQVSGRKMKEVAAALCFALGVDVG